MSNKTLNKAGLVEALRAKNGLTVKQAGEVVDTIFGTVQSTLSRGESVRIIGFGSFNVKDRAERAGRNPQTNESIVIPASKAVTFKAGKELKSLVNN